VVGNKTDKESERKVATLKAKQWCKEHGKLELYETSAKTSENVEETFTAIAKSAANHDSEEM
jgi:GTPase SAR1 family protein